MYTVFLKYRALCNQFQDNPLADEKNFRLVQIETNCRQHFKGDLK